MISECHIPRHLFLPEALASDSFIFSFSLFPSLPLLPFISPSLSHRHTCADKHHTHTDNPLSTSSLQFLRKSSQESPWYSEEPNPPPTFQLLRRSFSWKNLWKRYITYSLIGVEGWCPSRVPVKLCKTGARNLMACSCYKKAFFGKNRERNQPIPSRCHHLFLVIFRGRSGWVSMATDASSAQ